jgi:hypothetical protein
MSCFATLRFPALCAPLLVFEIAKKSNPEMSKCVPVPWLTLFLRTLLSFHVSGLRDPHYNNSLPLRTSGIRNAEIPNPETCRSSAPNWDQWLIASPDPTGLCLFQDFTGQGFRTLSLFIPSNRNAETGLSFPSSHTRVKPHATSLGSDGYRSMCPDLTAQISFSCALSSCLPGCRNLTI